MGALSELVGSVALGVRHLVALILAVLLVPLSIFSLGAFQAQAALGSGFYKDAFAHVALYETWPSAIGAQIAHQIALGAKATDGGGAPLAIQRLKAGDWADLLRKIAPADWSRRTIERTLDQAFADPPPATIHVSLIELREHVQSGLTAGEYDALLLALASDVAVDESGVPFATSFAAGLLSAKVEEIPDQTEIQWAGEIGADGEGPPVSIPTIRNVLRGVSALPLLAILPILLLVVRSRRSAARWIGIPVVLGAVVTLTLAASAEPFIESIVSSTVSRIPAVVAPELLTLMRGLAMRFAESMASGLTVVAAVASVATVAVVIFTLRPQRRATISEELASALV